MATPAKTPALDPRISRMSEINVTIIIPCYNAAPWVGAAIESALAQTVPEKEIIFVNDGSTDESLSIARRYESRGITVIDQPNRGASAARNAGLRLAHGAYVQFLDADDLLAPDKLPRQLARLVDAGTDVLASGAWARFQGDPSQAVFQPQPNWRDLTGSEFLAQHYEDGSMMHPAAWLAPRALLERAGPWDESLTLNDDGEYFARVMLAAGRIVFCGDARSFYRTGLAASLSGRTDRRSLESLYRSVDLTIAHLLRADDSPRARTAAANGWKWIAFELYPGAPDLARRAEENCRRSGGSRRRLPGGKRFQLAAHLLGWRLAKLLFA